VCLRTDAFYDLLGSTTFVTLAIGSFVLASGWYPRQMLVSGERSAAQRAALLLLRPPRGAALVAQTRGRRLAGMVTLWAVRLGSFLLMRVLRTGGDSRFKEAKDKPREPLR
jgi:steroid 5-alpha reductase family enzyme